MKFCKASEKDTNLQVNYQVHSPIDLANIFVSVCR